MRLLLALLFCTFFSNIEAHDVLSDTGVVFKILPREDDDMRIVLAARRQGGYLGYPRNYHAPLAPNEIADIRYIVTFLANKSIISIFNNQSSLESAGDRIDHIHPLRFLEAVFGDDELKVGVRNIRNKSLVWKDFIGGVKESLTTESSIGNVNDQQLLDFCTRLKISYHNVSPLVMQKRWDEFVDALIKIPRTGDYDRFGC